MAALGSAILHWDHGTHLRLEGLHFHEPVLRSHLLLSDLHQLLLLGHHLLFLAAHLQQRFDLGKEMETDMLSERHLNSDEDFSPADM